MAGLKHRVMLVDSQPVFMEGLQRLIGTLDDFMIVAKSLELSEAIATFNLHQPQVLICDLQMRGDSTEWLIRTAIAAEWKPSVLVASSSTRREDVLGAIEIGASGFLTRTAAQEEFVTALRKLAAGQNYLQPEVAHIVFKKMRTGGADEGLPILTSRERLLLELLGQGSRPKDIAQALQMAPSTVKTHIRSLFRKFQVNSRTQLVLKAVDLKLIDVAQPDGSH